MATVDKQIQVANGRKVSKGQVGITTRARARTRDDNYPVAVSAETYEMNTMSYTGLRYCSYIGKKRGSDHERLPDCLYKSRLRVLPHLVSREDDRINIASAVSIQA
ncbi:MAG: hypothetical protein M1834_005555 [Cirrosporium novae-zelandiae]|nr:MAG: hypothetical protein M1834_005555 [Cirrosporium novae-zelandiae]